MCPVPNLIELQSSTPAAVAGYFESFSRFYTFGPCFVMRA